MNLSEGQVGKKYIVNYIILEKKLKYRLQILGMTKNAHIQILNKSFNGSLIFKLRGTRFAISNDISNAIIVNEIF